ncbi:MAG: choice-of-anchor M domain-containing protein, partial [Angustibacter sp.]
MKRHCPAPRRVAALLLAVPLIATPQQALAATWEDRLVLDQGHVDAVHITLNQNELQLKLREDVTGTKVEHETEDIVLHVTDAAQLSVPDGAAFDFLGPAGQTIWLIPEVQNPQVVWAGWDAETIASGELADDALELELSSATGPGTVHVFNNSPVGEPVMLFNPQDGPDAIDFKAGPGNHSHANWAFSKPGRYDLTFAVRGTLANGTAVSDSASYVMVVGELPADTPTPTPSPDPTPSPTPTIKPSPTPTVDPSPGPTPGSAGQD